MVKGYAARAVWLGFLLPAVFLALALVFLLAGVPMGVHGDPGGIVILIGLLGCMYICPVLFVFGLITAIVERRRAGTVAGPPIVAVLAAFGLARWASYLRDWL